MGDVIADPSHIDLWLAALDGNPDWDALLGNYRSTTDYPACQVYKQLAELNPEAKVVLSVRDAERWFESINETIMSPAFAEAIEPTPFGELNKRAVWDFYGGRVADRDYMVNAFYQHIENVKRWCAGQQSAISGSRSPLVIISGTFEPIYTVNLQCHSGRGRSIAVVACQTSRLSMIPQRQTIVTPTGLLPGVPSFCPLRLVE